MKNYQERYKVISFIIISIVIVFIIKLFYIQIINKNYKFSANNNVLRYEVQQAVRGLIYDRNNKLIVENIPAYDLMIIPRELNKNGIDTTSLCELININKEVFINKINKSINYSKYKESVFIKHLSLEEASALSEKLFQFPGFYLQKITMRNYPYNSATHIIGYLGEVDKEKTSKDRYYTKGDLSGVTGIEAAYEKNLRGKKGMKIKLVDVHNRDQGKFQNGKFDTLAIRGSNLISTVDIELQAYGESLMKNKIGAIVAIEPSTGEILSLISAPYYNPNFLVGRNRSENYIKLTSNKNKPLFNRALQGTYPPGSIFKLINGLIALQQNVITDKSVLNCEKGYEYAEEKILKCHHHTSPVTLKQAIEISCNTYFCNIYEKYFRIFKNSKTAYDEWYSHLDSFGIGKYMNNDFISGSPGKLPSSKYFDQVYNGSWNANTTISMAIGQGELLLTPIQMANMTCILANKGYYYTPHIIKTIEGTHIDSSFIEKKYCSIEKKHFDPIIEGMDQVINGKEGTAKNARIENITICGKTGTAQNPHGEDHSIFIAFAPKKNPKIAIAVYIENGGWGSTWAAPIGSLMIEKYIKKDIQNKLLEEFILNGNLLNQL